MIVALCAGVALVATWAAFFWLELPLLWAVVLSATTVLLASCFLGLRTFRAWRRRRATLQPAQSGDETRRAELAALQREMTSAVQDLKRSRLAGGGSAALYALPWYVVMGPSAAGKSTALEQSGLAFRARRGAGPSSRAAPSNRGCKFWFAKEAILLDTAGGFVSADSEGDEWRAFLGLLEKHRPREPLDGLLLAVSVSDLSDPDADLESLARTLRSRVDEVARLLGRLVPVYVLVTKVDLLPGFVDFFSDLGDREASQVWGASFDLGSKAAGAPAERVRAELERLRGVVQARAFERLRAQLSPSERARVLRFPREFRRLERPLRRFLGQLFQPSEFEDTPLLRGFYLSSGSQLPSRDESDPHGLGVAAPTDLQLSAASIMIPASASARGYFLQQLFQRVMFPDRGAVPRSYKRKQRTRRRQVALVTAFACLTLLTVLPATLAYLDNAELMDVMQSDLQSVPSAPRRAAAVTTALTSLREAPALREGPGSRPSSAALDARLQRWKRLLAESERPAVRHWWGPYVAPDLALLAQRRYLQVLRAAAQGPLHDQLVRQLRSTAELPELDPASFAAEHDALRLYLALCEPARLQDEWARPALARVWARAVQRGALREGDHLLEHVESYLAALKSRPGWAWTRDDALVARARARLRSERVDDLAYGQVVALAEAAPPISPSDVFFGPASEFVTAGSDVRVRGPFTRIGWERVRKALSGEERRIFFEPWVLGYSQASESSWSPESLRRRYFREYTREWEEFLGQLVVRVPGSVREAIRELSELRKSDGPYVRLFRRLAHNARLELEVPPEEGSLAATGEKLAEGARALAGQEPAPKPRRPSPVETDFARLVGFAFGDALPSPEVADLPRAGLSAYLDELYAVESLLRQIQEGQVEAGPLLQEVKDKVRGVETTIQGLGRRESLAVGRLLLNPLLGSLRAVQGAEALSLNERWHNEVYLSYRRLRAAHPFDEDAPSDVPLSDFVDFFRPDSGILWGFYEENLASRYRRTPTRFSLRERRSGISPALSECLLHGQNITKALFKAGGGELFIPFAIAMRATGSSVGKTLLSFGQTELEHENGPQEWHRVHWPGQGNGARLEVSGQEAGDPFRDKLQFHGDFAFFRLLAAGRIQRVSARSPDLEAAWPLRGGKARVSIRLRYSGSNNPFLTDFFSHFRCPAQLLGASGAGR